jgi:hypothetical protein
MKNKYPLDMKTCRGQLMSLLVIFLQSLPQRFKNFQASASALSFLTWHT